jgi:hypothetical protein
LGGDIIFTGKRLIILLVGLLAAAGGILWYNLARPNLSFPRSESDYYQPDPLLGHRHRPNARREFEWPEHPSGRIIMRTNNLGFRHDHDIAAIPQPDVTRVLVAGDSHMDGVVHNPESFSTQLESLLNRGVEEGRRYEVINAAAGYYGPDNYRAVPRAYGSLGFEILIVGLYAGNDFLDAAKAVEKELPAPLERPNGYIAALKMANKRHGGAVAQMLNQEHYFNTFPSMKQAILEKVERQFLQLNEEVRGKGKRLYLILIPTKHDVEPQLHGQGWAEAVRELGLNEENLRAASGMRTILGQRLGRAGIAVFDPTEAMRNQAQEFYWKKDYHLNGAGHAFLARWFHDEFRQNLPEARLP